MKNDSVKFKMTIKIILLAIFVIALGYFFTQWVTTRRVAVSSTDVAAISNENTPAGKVLGEEGNQLPSKMYTSQNFKTPQITFGGDAVTVPSGEQSVAPQITNLRSELLTAKTDQQVKFFLGWKTNKLCTSLITYTKEGQAEGKTVSDDNYGFIHSVEIAPLSYSTSYSYEVSARDKWGNVTKSDKLAFYTGAPNVSILDLISGAFKDMFGWKGKR